MTKVYAIGDVHGCLELLQRLVGLCARDTGDEEPIFVFLGDYVDRGPDSRGVIDFLIDLQTRLPDQVICLKGNHEDLLLAAFDYEGNEQNWLRNGGIQTLESYRIVTPIDIPLQHIAWLGALPAFHDDGKRFFVHAGVHPSRPLDRQDEHDLLWIREPFLSSDKDFGRLVVHGHTPTASGLADQRANRLNLDTGAVYGRALTAAVFDDEVTAPLRLLSARADGEADPDRR